MTLDKLSPQKLYSVVSNNQKTLHLLLVVVLSLYLLAFFAELTWRIIPEPTLDAPAKSTFVAKRTSGAQREGDISKVQRLNLFGNVQEKPVITEPEEVVTDAPETSLNLTLTGVVVSSNQKAATAIIENRGAQSVYGLGEKIEGTNATLQQVFSDRVIIRNGVRNETLMLDGVDFEEANRRRANRQKPANRTEVERLPRELSNDAISAAELLRERPSDFTDYISVSPKVEDGQLIGFSITPGKNTALFEASGLKAGDVIAQINGLDLTDPQQSREAMTELTNAQSIELTLIRDGDYLTIYLDLPEPEAE